uniref:MPN domain-containing protein n=1 Tax=Romanomermis culicivorax TaxID=13658 RepID=A0A915JGB7_ROMCU
MALFAPEVNYCYVSSDVYYSCMHHALSTEVEEVMGLLIGWKDDEKNTCYITNSLPLKRLDKRKDRVEISPEVLSDSITICDNLNAEINTAHEKSKISAPHAPYRNPFSSSLGDGFSLPSTTTRNIIEPKNLHAIGWYHSHPHITVYPSDVDLRTQDSFQSMVDKMWFGLIFGVYNNEEPTKTNHLQLIAFQTIMHNGRMVQSLIPVIVDPHLSPVTYSICNNKPDSNGVLQRVSLDVETKKILDCLHAPVVPNHKTLENLRDSFLLLADEEKLEYEKARQEAANDNNMKNDVLSSTSRLWNCQLSYVYSKNIWKVISMLAEPMYVVLDQVQKAVEKNTSI